MNRTRSLRLMSLLITIVLLSAAMTVTMIANAIGDEGPPKGLNSFTADTLVAVPDGSRPISDIEVGDVVLGLHPETGAVEPFEVIEIIKSYESTIIEVTINGALLETTREHLFFTEKRGWVSAKNLTIDDRIQTIDGEFGSVDSIAVVKGEYQPVYNLMVEKAYTFYVGKGAWLVGS